MEFTNRLTIAIFLISVLFCACSSGESSGTVACVSGSSKECTCVDGSKSAQVCRDDGNGYGTCGCADEDVTGDDVVTKPDGTEEAAGVDHSSPIASIVAPKDGATVTGIVQVQIEASDNVGVTRVAVLVGGVEAFARNEAPYEGAWDTSGLMPGTYKLAAVAEDAVGNTARDEISVTVAGACVGNDCPPASVTIITPVDGATVCGKVTIEAAATDDTGLQELEFFVDGTSLGVDEDSPYQKTWDTLTATAGAHVVKVIARDLAGHEAFAEASVTVKNTGGDCDNLPSVFITNPATNGYVRGIVTIKANASDDVGVERVRFYIDNGKISEDDAVPYEADWDTGEFGEGAHTVKVMAEDTAAQQSAHQVQVTVDRTPPQVQLLEPDGGMLSGATVTLKASATDNFLVKSVRLGLTCSGNETVDAIVNEAPWEATLSISGLAGECTAWATATDGVGLTDTDENWVCLPACGSRECGYDACGGSCGECFEHDNSFCNEGGQCDCQPSECWQLGLECGGPYDDGCGGTSWCDGDCGCGDACDQGTCVFQFDPCEARECGPSPCGGTCGTCQFGTCIDGDCVCGAGCAGKVCGSDGCGGSCGQCATGFCNASQTACENPDFGKGSHVNALYIPAEPYSTGAEAYDFPNLYGSTCLDINGDGSVDNGLGALLGTLTGFGVDANAEIATMFANGSMHLLLDLGDDPGAYPFTLDVHRGTPGAAAHEYLVYEQSYVDGAPMLHIAGAEIVAGKLDVGPITFPMSGLLETFLASSGMPPMEITLDRARLVGTVDGVINEAGVAFKDGTLAGAIYKANLDRALYLSRKWCSEDPEAPADICGYLQMADMSLIETFLSWDQEIPDCGKKLQVYDSNNPMIVVGEEDNCQAVSVCIFWGADKAKLTDLTTADPATGPGCGCSLSMTERQSNRALVSALLYLLVAGVALRWARRRLSEPTC